MKLISIAFAALLLLVGTALYWLDSPLVQKIPAPAFEVGQTYAVLWSCLNQIGCYGEIFEVLEIRADGWLRVRTQLQEEWWINPAQALSIQSYTQHASPTPAHTGPVLQVAQ